MYTQWDSVGIIKQFIGGNLSTTSEKSAPWVFTQLSSLCFLLSEPYFQNRHSPSTVC